MSGNKQKINSKQRKITKKRTGNTNRGKIIVVSSICATIAIIAIVCAIIFIPKISKDGANNDFSRYVNYPSSFPDYFSNLKEEKEAFDMALSTCNKAAEAKLASKGIKTEYRETNIDVINKWAGFNSRINAPYVEIGVDPTGGDTYYKDPSRKRTYHCYANISGASIYEITIAWDERNE